MTISSDPSGPPGLPPVFVINMETAARRRDEMRARLDTIDLPFSFFKAVDGRELDPAECANYDGQRRRRYFGRDMTPGEIGCLLSHRAIYRRMIDEGIPAALVLEDDVTFRPDFPDVLRAILAMPIHWDLIRFLGSDKIYAKGRRIIGPLVGNYAIARLPGTHGGAHAYLLTLNAARSLFAHTERSWVPIDTLQGRCWQTGLESLVVHPAPLSTDEAAGTSISDVRFDKTLRTGGWARRLYPLNRFLFKAGETVGKRKTYWGAWLRDRNSRRKLTTAGRESP